MAFSVQLAAEFTSAAAPRTVLHAARAMQPPAIRTVIIFRTMVTPPSIVRNDHGRGQVALSTALAAEFTSLAAPRTVLHAATVRPLPIRATIINLRNMFFSPVCRLNERGMGQRAP